MSRTYSISLILGKVCQSTIGIQIAKQERETEGCETAVSRDILFITPPGFSEKEMILVMGDTFCFMVLLLLFRDSGQSSTIACKSLSIIKR